ncbi:MAG: response regulator, partial [Eubacterium sp.]|nr:response regulator [Eubacterium sp.]
MRQIRVLVVEDSLVFRELLVRNLNADPGLTVVATASDPFEARDAIIQYKPDVMTLDIELPRMSGIEFLRKLMPQYPLPVVVISSLSDKVFDALNAGAVDFVAKPSVSNSAQLEKFMKKELPVKIKIASIARVSSWKKAPVETLEHPLTNTNNDFVVAIGASTGGTEAISSVIKEFDTDIPGVVVVQHMPPGFTEMYARRLNEQCRVRVKEARSGDIVMPGQVLIAPGGDSHMQLVKMNGTYQTVIKHGP